MGTAQFINYQINQNQVAISEVSDKIDNIKTAPPKIRQLSGKVAAVDGYGAWATLGSVTGAGFLDKVVLYSGTINNTFIALEVTIDGVATVIYQPDGQSVNLAVNEGHTDGKTIVYEGPIAFSTGFSIRGQNNSTSSPTPMHLKADYGLN